MLAKGHHKVESRSPKVPYFLHGVLLKWKRFGNWIVRHILEVLFSIIWVRATEQKTNGNFDAQSTMKGGVIGLERDYKNQWKQKVDIDGENWTVTVAGRETTKDFFFSNEIIQSGVSDMKLNWRRNRGEGNQINCRGAVDSFQNNRSGKHVVTALYLILQWHHKENEYSK